MISFLAPVMEEQLKEEEEALEEAPSKAHVDQE